MTWVTLTACCTRAPVMPMRLLRPPWPRARMPWASCSLPAEAESALWHALFSACILCSLPFPDHIPSRPSLNSSPNHDRVGTQTERTHNSACHPANYAEVQIPAAALVSFSPCLLPWFSLDKHNPALSPHTRWLAWLYAHETWTRSATVTSSPSRESIKTS